MDLDLAGRSYIVSGGTKGLGLATVESLVGEGASVVVVARDEERLRSVRDRLGTSVATVKGDLDDPGVAAVVILSLIHI